MSIDNDPRLRELQAMHKRRTVRRESIIAWYRWYSQFPSNRLPTMHPERSDIDLIRTMALWMDLTDAGGSPGFPYDYRTDLAFPAIDPDREPRKSAAFPLGLILIMAGIITLWFHWKIGAALLLAGPIVLYLGYRLSGGATNPNLMTKGTTLYEREGRRVLEWVQRQRESP